MSAVTPETLSVPRYRPIAMLLHWLIALGLVGMVIGGMTLHAMIEATETGGDHFLFGPDGAIASTLAFSAVHKSFGFTVFALVLIRIAYRLANPPPPLPATMKRWERLAAHGTHILLYGLMLAMPISGWLMVSASPWGIPTVLFGVVQIPHILPQNAEVEAIMKTVHDVLSKLLIAAFVVHVAAALRHQFVLKDGVLLRMMPARKAT